MERKPKNPNAFPIALKDNNNPFNSDAKGMTLRDYFAAKAMQGYISTFSNEDPCCNVDDLKEDISEMSYKVADAMLNQREK